MGNSFLVNLVSVLLVPGSPWRQERPVVSPRLNLSEGCRWSFEYADWARQRCRLVSSVFGLRPFVDY